MINLTSWLNDKGFQQILKKEQKTSIWTLGAVTILTNKAQDTIYIEDSIGNSEVGKLSGLKIEDDHLELNDKKFFISKKRQSV